MTHPAKHALFPRTCLKWSRIFDLDGIKSGINSYDFQPAKLKPLLGDQKILFDNSTQSSSLIVSNLGIVSSTKLISSTISFQSLQRDCVGPCIPETIPITEISPFKPTRDDDCAV